ncbi:MAG TPA: thiamine phosphate synthase, partial [Gemmataceae bacterium]|nr:thiamine phosphate synthase [Gemmataceae bacterium]
ATAAEHACDEAARFARSATADGIVTSEHLILGLLAADAALKHELIEFGLRAEAMETGYHAQIGEPLPLDSPLEFPDPVEWTDVSRILDACANRAREAVRVLEDFVRFSLDDAFLSRQLKELRHELTESLALVSEANEVAARDTLGDVGSAIDTAGERIRHSADDVVRANAKRLQEALRSLEEYGKLRNPEAGARMEALRYKAYTLEKALLVGHSARMKLAAAKLYVLLTGATCRAALDWTIAEAAAGGADVFQLREKNLSDAELLERARDVRRWTRKAGVLFIVNDRPDIARLAEADGVHLGQDDLPVREARRIVGPHALIGVSTHTVEQVRRAILDGVNYLGVGPTFSSTTKTFAELAGLDFVRAATAETSLPAFVLGGVTAGNVDHVVEAGGRRVAVSAAIAAADDPRAAARAIRARLP